MHSTTSFSMNGKEGRGDTVSGLIVLLIERKKHNKGMILFAQYRVGISAI